ncbi:MAG: UDP-N-acetylmuramoyl-tripeptide--D-alanyl-D-alanine ligase [Rhodobacteraceae bacterium]|nr:MAG: UDP-N-acetylmuramoyl-tripeptide--D-alanyl-D-alanine ligase [Paracoccaceae bacterium]
MKTSMENAIKDCRKAIADRDFEKALQIAANARKTENRNSPSLARFSLQAIIAVEGEQAAQQAFATQTEGLRPDQKDNLRVSLALDIADKALQDRRPEQVLVALGQVQNWLKPNHQERAVRYRLYAELALGRPDRAAHAVRDLEDGVAKGGADRVDWVLETLGGFFRTGVFSSNETPSSATSSKPALQPQLRGAHFGPPTVQRSILWTKARLLDALPDLVQISGPEWMRPIETVSFHALSAGSGTLVIPAIMNEAAVLKDPEIATRDQGAIISNALFHGASAAITDDPDIIELPNLAPVFYCPDRRAAFLALAKAGRQRLSGHLVGVTGSYGKTTTREMIAQMLGSFGPTSTAIDNRNALSGISETLASIPPFATDCVLEIGISIPGTMGENIALAQPDIPILTTVADSHLENYADQRELLLEKAGIFDHAGSGVALIGRAALDLDERLQAQAFEKLNGNYWSVGVDPHDDIQLVKHEEINRRGVATVRVHDDSINLTLSRSDRHYAIAACFALGVARIKGISLREAAEALSIFRPLEAQRGLRWRMELPGNGNVAELIDDSQNASPDTVRSLLQNLARRTPARRVLVLGDMVQLGDDALAKHVALAPDIEASGIALLITVGPQSAHLAAAVSGRMDVRSFDDTWQASREIRSLIGHGDLVVLKGSHVMQMVRLRNTLAQPTRRQIVRSVWRIEDELDRSRGSA